MRSPLLETRRSWGSSQPLFPRGANMVSVGNPCKRCQTRLVDLELHVREKCPSRPDGGKHMVRRPTDIKNLYMAKVRPDRESGSINPCVIPG